MYGTLPVYADDGLTEYIKACCWETYLIGDNNNHHIPGEVRQRICHHFKPKDHKVLHLDDGTYAKVYKLATHKAPPSFDHAQGNRSDIMHIDRSRIGWQVTPNSKVCAPRAHAVKCC
jgi:hypothetical protein